MNHESLSSTLPRQIYKPAIKQSTLDGGLTCHVKDAKNAVSESNNMQQKQSDACHCYCKDIMPMMQQQMELMTELIKQNNELITQGEAREQYLIELIEINNELIAEREEADEDNSPQYLDMDS